MGDRYGEGTALANLGFSTGMQGNLSEAFNFHGQSLLVAREIGSLYHETYTLINLSAIAGIQMDAPQAMEFARQAIVISEKTRDRSAEAWAQLYMGHAYLLLKKYAEAREAYTRSLLIRVELNQSSLSMEPLAGLVETALLMDDLHRASQEVEKILRHFDEGGSLEGTDEPLRVYHACYQFLYRKKDPRAQKVLQDANQLLEAQVSNFKDETARTLFVENIPWRRAIYESARLH
jgi:tetratricopeptide (TPR) repeat protein